MREPGDPARGEPLSVGATTVLMYHRLGRGRLPGREAGEEVYAVAPDAFESHLEALEAAPARPLSPEDLLQQGGGGAAGADPRPSFCLTFDDGNVSDHGVALPALRRRGWQGLFFVVPAWAGRPGYMSWAEIREMQSEGMTIGAHGLDHTRLGRLDDDAVRRQLRESRRLFEAELGQAPRTLSLPGGSGGRRVVRLAAGEGFELVATSEPALVWPGQALAPLPRFAVRRGDAAADVRALAEQRRSAVWRQRARHRLLQSARALLGEGSYARVRGLWAHAVGEAASDEPREEA